MGSGSAPAGGQAVASKPSESRRLVAERGRGMAGPGALLFVLSAVGSGREWISSPKLSVSSSSGTRLSCNCTAPSLGYRSGASRTSSCRCGRRPPARPSAPAPRRRCRGGSRCRRRRDLPPGVGRLGDAPGRRGALAGEGDRGAQQRVLGAAWPAAAASPAPGAPPASSAAAGRGRWAARRGRAAVPRRAARSRPRRRGRGRRPGEKRKRWGPLLAAQGVRGRGLRLALGLGVSLRAIVRPGGR